MSSENIEVSEEDPGLDWGQLPYVALALIFSYLPDRDKFNASLVNRAWSEGFAWPGNWRQREMIFYGSCEEAVAQEQAFAERFGAQLRCLRLRCWSPAQGPALELYLDQVSGVLGVLAQTASLHEIHVADVEGLDYTDEDLITVNDLLFESERRAEGKAKMGSVLENLIRSQKELRVLDLQEVDCAWEVGLRLIIAAASSPSASVTLHTLLLVGAFSRLPSPNASSSSADYLLAMANFHNLAKLRLEYRYVSCELLVVLGASAGEQFRTLMILCTEEDGPEWPHLEDNAWKCLSSRCPNLRVELTIVFLEGGTRHTGWRSALLKSGMPLSSLCLEGDTLRLQAGYWDATPMLELLLREYRNTLEHLSLGIGQRPAGMTSAGKLTAEMVGRALRLQRLKTLNLSGQIDSESIKALYAILDQHNEHPGPAHHLERLTLTAWCASEEEVEQLLKANRSAIQSRMCSTTEVRLVPML